jgi:hypothetical protein
MKTALIVTPTAITIARTNQRGNARAIGAPAYPPNVAAAIMTTACGQATSSANANVAIGIAVRLGEGGSQQPPAGTRSCLLLCSKKCNPEQNQTSQLCNWLNFVLLVPTL